MPKYLANIDLAKNELRNARIQNLATAPSSPVLGQIYYDTSQNNIYFWDGTAWQAWLNVYAYPIGPAGGSLTGTYPNPTLGNGVVSDANVASGAAIALSKLAVNPLARANHTGTQLAATISDFDTQVRTSRLDQLSAPTNPVSLGGQRLTNVVDPVNPQDAATKAYVDAASLGLDVKASVRAATTANITLSGTQTIDGVVLSAGQRVLVKNQTDATQNGIYVVATGSWARSSDANSSASVTPGLFTFVEEGSSNSDSGFILTTDGTITLGTTQLTFTQFTGAGQINAGQGLTKTGNTIDAGGTTDRISVYADTIDIATTYAGQPSITTLGTIATGTWQGTPIGIAYGGTGATTAAQARTNLGVATKFVAALVGGNTTEVVTHNLNTRECFVQVLQTVAPYAEVEAQVEHTSVNTITIYSDQTIPASTYEVVVIG